MARRLRIGARFATSSQASTPDLLGGPVRHTPNFAALRDGQIGEVSLVMPTLCIHDIKCWGMVAFDAATLKLRERVRVTR